MKRILTSIILLLLISGLVSCEKKPSSSQQPLSSLSSIGGVQHKVDVVAARRDLDKGVVLSYDNLALIRIEKSEYQPENYYTEEQVDQISGIPVTKSLERGEVITPNHLK